MQNQTELLATESVKKLFFKLSVPAIAAQIINLLYNVVDRMYIGHMPEVGKLALTGVGVCLPLIMIISAFAMLAGMGSAPRASIFMGQGNNKKAEQTLGNAVTLLFIISILLTIVFQLFADKLLLMFGASENTIEYASDYMRIYGMGTIFVQMTLGLNAFISAQGFSTTAMLTVLIGAIANIILDPIFIFLFNMGVSGAALATIISQAISMVWILCFLLGKKTNLKIRKENLKLNAKIVLPCIALGLSPFIMQATESLISVSFNASLLKYGGDVAVGAMTIVASVFQFSMLPLMGMTQGAMPILSYNFGAQNGKRVRDAFKIQIISCLAFSTILWAAVQITPETFILIFNNDPELLGITSRMLRIYMAVSCLFGAQIACQQTFVAIGNSRNSLFLALLRKIILLLPLIYIMPMFFENKTMGVFMAEPVADAIAVSVTVILFAVQFKKAMRKLDCEKNGGGKGVKTTF